MVEPTKKISFGFSKFTKKTSLGLGPSSTQNKIQLIDCLEAQTIKLKDAVEKIYQPLVIPMPKSNLTLIQRKINLTKQEVDDRPDSALTPDELAARELIMEAQTSILTGEHSKVLQLPIINDDTQQPQDKDESSLEDYENVPISDYGLAMLRGMGWKEGTGIGRTCSIAKVKEPNLRPKGMGLGANIKLIKKVKESNGDELILKKGCFAKIIDGKQKGQYCEVQGFDDEAGRIIVKTTLQGLVLALNEFLVIPVTKEEYAKSSKVVNNTKYEEYINSQSQHSSRTLNTSEKNEKYIDDYRKHKDTSKVDTKHRHLYQNEPDYKIKTRKKDYRKPSNDSSSEDEYYRKKNTESSRNKH